MIKQLLKSVIAKYPDLSVSRRSIVLGDEFNCSGKPSALANHLLAADKSGYFSQPPSIIVNSV